MPSNAPPYRLIYWPGIPGRGEHIRLAFEEAGVPYADTAAEADGMQQVLAQISDGNLGAGHGNVPPLAPPVLVHGDLLLSQTANILLYLGPRLGLAPAGTGTGTADEAGTHRVLALAMTALDGFSDEVHNCHHPVSTALYYEDQKPEARRASQAYVTHRLPKYLAYFERVLQAKAKAQSVDGGGDTPWLYGASRTYADLVLFQSLDGTAFQFPRAVAAARASGRYARVFALSDAVRRRPNVAAYLASPRRQAYSLGVYRYYGELDLLAEETTKER